MGHDVQADAAERRSTAEAGVSLPLAGLLELLDAVRDRGLRFVGFRDFMALRHREPVALLTFDDGYASLYTDLHPELRRRGIPSLVFLISGVYQHGHESLPFQVFALRDRRDALAPEALAALEALPEMAEVPGGATLKTLLARPEAEVARAFGALDRAAAMSLERRIAKLGVVPRTTLGAGQIERMLASGLVDFGAHSVSHVSFQRIPPADVAGEIVESCRFLGEMLGRPPRELPFAYPYGAVTPRARAVVRRHCAAGFTTSERRLTRLDADDLIPRLELRPDLGARLDAAGALRDWAGSLAERVTLRLRAGLRRARQSPLLARAQGASR
jgi:peptidoglycan/xylan/chitin deacetylase (PgdA/CDA1 family)